jgi:uncharacterized protein with von Willebrand factor type A (vWA) domain
VANTWALAYGRFMIGVATEAEVSEIHLLAKTIVGDDTVDFLQEILGEAIQLSHEYNFRFEAQLAALAREWLELLGVDPDEELPKNIVMVVCDSSDAHGDDDDDGEGASAKSDGDGDDEGKSKDGDDESEGKDGDDDGDEGGSSSTGEHGETKGGDGELAEVMQSALRKAADAAADHDIVPDATPKLTTPAAMAKVFNGKPSRSNVEERPPSNKLRIQSRKLATTLETLSLPSITRTKVPSLVPPGRLRGREAVRKAADEQRGAMTASTPWERSKRRRTTNKPVIVGVMTDVSGSMRWAQTFVADFAWVLATAGVHIGARTAAVTFGDHVTPITKPGDVPRNVLERYANGGTEEFDHAAAAIESVLHLRAQNAAAKVLFIVSDGHLVKAREVERAQMWIRDWTRAGTHVFWLGCSLPNRYAKSGKAPGGLHFINAGYEADMDNLYNEVEKKVVAAASLPSGGGEW